MAVFDSQTPATKKSKKSTKSKKKKKKKKGKSKKVEQDSLGVSPMAATMFLKFLGQKLDDPAGELQSTSEFG